MNFLEIFNGIGFGYTYRARNKKEGHEQLGRTTLNINRAANNLNRDVNLTRTKLEHIF